ncbi:MAG: 23S rRNA (uracil(1939)-C(5))-methyltransferase RlmD [Saprospiraceae bacterium]
MGRSIKTRQHVQIIDIADEGRAIGKTPEGEVLLVEGALPGAVVDVQIFRKKKGLAMARTERIIEPSPWQQDPFCAHFGHCGGCKWQHLDYAQQLKFKENNVREALRRIAKIDGPDIRPILPSEKTTHFRNKLEYSFARHRWKTPEEIRSDNILEDLGAVGFHPPGFYDKVVDIQECHLQDEPTNAIRNRLRDHTRSKGYSYYDFLAQKGLMRGILVRKAAFTQDLMVAVIFGAHDQEAIEEVMSFLVREFPGMTSCQYAVNTKRNDALHDLEFITFAGQPYMHERIGTITYRIGPKSFFQTNSYQAYHMFETVNRMAGLTGKETVYDLYCGTGSIGLYLAQNAGHVVGIEVIPEAIVEAEMNRQINQIADASFYSGDVKDILTDEFIEKHGSPDLVIVDPPRAGLHNQVVEYLNVLKADRLIYVSCNPATQARDLAKLQTVYRDLWHQPMDMFPHTHHIENITLLNRKT